MKYLLWFILPCLLFASLQFWGDGHKLLPSIGIGLFAGLIGLIIAAVLSPDRGVRDHTDPSWPLRF